MDNSASASGALSLAGYPFRVRVLAVEEDPISLTTLTLMLQRCGFEATAKASPEEALRELEMNPDSFDLVLTVAGMRGNGMDGFGLLKHLKNRLPVVLFSGPEPAETVKRAILAGASDFLVKPLRDKDIQNIWKHVVQWRRTATNGADPQKRGSAGVVHDSDQGGSKKAKFSSSPQLQATIVKAAQELRGTKGYSSRAIKERLAAQGVEVTTDQVTRHMGKYIRELPAIPFPGSSHYNDSKNYSATGSSEVYMRSEGAKNVNQTSVRSNGVSLLGVGALLENESYRASHDGHLHNNDNNATAGYGNHYGNGNSNGNANMVSASPASHLAQPVQQAMPNTSLFPTNMMGTMDNPNPARQQAFPQISRLSYNGNTGGIALSSWPVDDDGDMMRSYQLGENQVLQNSATTRMTRGTHEHGAAGQTSASQAQDLTDIFSWESTEENGTAGTSDGTGVGTNEVLECFLDEDGIDRFFRY
ncbi:unnamed protein product [Alopecurus aequalis]